MVTHSSVLTWKIPGTGEPGGLPSIGSHRVGHNWSDIAAAQGATGGCVMLDLVFKCFPLCTHYLISPRLSFPEKHLFLLYWLCQSLWLCGSQETVENSERDGNTRPPSCQNLHAGQEATVRTGHETTDWFQTGKGVRQGCILSPCLFNLYSEYIMRNAGLGEAQAGIKIARRNINNLRWHHSYGRKWRRTKEPLDERERGQWKSWLKKKKLA